MQVTRNNHFVPQSYLRRWSVDGNRVWCYRILVPNAEVPLWELRPVRGVAYQRDLYTSLINGRETDEFERWLEREIETPAQDAIERAVHGDDLTDTEWEQLTLYLAAQDVRTPQNYIESAKRWDAEIPVLLQRILEEALQHLEEAAQTGQKPMIRQPADQQPFTDLLKVEVRPHAKPETMEGEFRVEVPVGRRLWLETQRHLLESTAKVLFSHSWSIAEAASGAEWFTSDHPVVRVNYYGKNNYDLGGGWGRRGCNLLMPLSPKHLLFAEIGEGLPRRLQLSLQNTIKIKRFIAERAHRMIFARQQRPEVNRFRPRVVDLEAYQAEQEAWNEWHDDQSRAEREHEESE